ncbi:MAG: hypothetical protein HFG56_07130 [Lachnospiraceae bacterium]|nr:hypothetical protein [Lachnospiraceae bacterium]
MQKTINSVQKKPKRVHKSFAEYLVTAAIAVTTLAIAASLFLYFRPFTLEDVWNTTHQLTSYVSQQVSDFRDHQVARYQEWKKKYLDAKVDNSAIITDENSAPLSPMTGDAVPFMDRTSDLGEVSGLNSEPVFPLQEDAIFSFMMDTALGPMLYYNQGDIRWKNYLYGGVDPISRYGCGPVCVAMIINSFGSASVTPVEMADWSAANGGYARHGGSYHNLIPDSLSAFGLQVDSVTERTAENAAALLDSGHILVALMGRGSLTQNGHFIVITQLCENGNVYIADPANYENCTKEWDLQQLMNELKQVYDHGGPLWAISMPGP